mmetsp:Transcript_11781/g.32799  ORF Transcript_11781/g.32799 Transcript_11781/m.32799 type:complete len:208 (+) Transcript_11781:185-808(+)
MSRRKNGDMSRCRTDGEFPKAPGAPGNVGILQPVERQKEQDLADEMPEEGKWVGHCSHAATPIGRPLVQAEEVAELGSFLSAEQRPDSREEADRLLVSTGRVSHTVGVDGSFGRVKQHPNRTPFAWPVRIGKLIACIDSASQWLGRIIGDAVRRGLLWNKLDIAKVQGISFPSYAHCTRVKPPWQLVWVIFQILPIFRNLFFFEAED